MTIKHGTTCQVCAKNRAVTTCYRDGPNGRRTYHVCEKCNQPASSTTEKIKKMQALSAGIYDARHKKIKPPKVTL